MLSRREYPHDWEFQSEVLFLRKKIIGSSIDELFKTLYYLCQTS